MNDILEERYFTWLYSHISDPEQTSPKRTYWNLARQLFKTEFTYIIPNDDNRWDDGRALRKRFKAEIGGDPLPTIWLDLACSMLEMLIALSERLEFQTDEPARYWFWQLMDNIHLAQLNDARYTPEADDVVHDVLSQVIWRTYSYSGAGGLFPLDRADQDQRQVELWYQMHSYLLEAV